MIFTVWRNSILRRVISVLLIPDCRRANRIFNRNTILPVNTSKKNYYEKIFLRCNTATGSRGA